MKEELRLAITGLNRLQQVALLRRIPEDQLNFLTTKPKIGEFGDPGSIVTIVSLSAVAITALVAWLRGESADLNVKFHAKALGFEVGFEVAASGTAPSEQREGAEARDEELELIDDSASAEIPPITDVKQDVQSDILAFFQDMNANPGDVLPARVFIVERMIHYSPNQVAAFSDAVNELLLDGMLEMQMGDVILTTKGWNKISRL